jgi:hypothetical protein
MLVVSGNRLVRQRGRLYPFEPGRACTPIRRPAVIRDTSDDGRDLRGERRTHHDLVL